MLYFIKIIQESDIGSLKLIINKNSGIPTKQLRLKFENSQPMDDDAKVLSDFKDFLTNPDTVTMFASLSNIKKLFSRCSDCHDSQIDADCEKNSRLLC
jgi:hypothetical protein